MRDNNLSGKLEAIETPALVIWGAEDNTVPLRDASVVADEWPDADLRILPKAGHWPQFETPDTARRMIASYLGLPRFSDKLHTPVDDDELLQIREIAQFLAHSDLGNDLNLAHRTRLAAQCEPRFYNHGDNIVRADEAGNELYIIQAGTVEVWSDLEVPDQEAHSTRKVADFRPGQIAGELAMLDQGVRSADMIAGPDGVTVLALNREKLLALCEDDAVLGTRVLWNMAAAVAHRGRFYLWQLQRAAQRAARRESSWDGKANGDRHIGDESHRLAANVGVERE
jgi:CRP-like cAMP-binding protein